jgi:hypothetical protein
MQQILPSLTRCDYFPIAAVDLDKKYAAITNTAINRIANNPNMNLKRTLIVFKGKLLFRFFPME